MTLAIQGPANVRAIPMAGAAPQIGAPAVLPSSEPPSVGQMQDAMSMLYLMMSKLRDAQVCEGKTRVETNEARSEAQQERRKAELEAAQRAASEGGVFDWLSEDIGLAGAVGLCTFNYALVAADIAVHKLDIVDNVKVDVVDVAAVATGRWEVLAADILLRKTDLAPEEARAIVEQVGIPQDAPGISDEDVKPIARDLLIANLVIASLVATVFTAGTTTGLCIALAGLAISTAGSQVAKHKVFDDVFGKDSSQWIGLGMQIYGAAASCMSGLASGAALSVAANGFAKGVVLSSQTKA